MKPVQPSQVALATSVPIALLLIWWVYKRKYTQKVEQSRPNLNAEESSHAPPSKLNAVSKPTSENSQVLSAEDNFKMVQNHEPKVSVTYSQPVQHSLKDKLSLESKNEPSSPEYHYLDIEPRIIPDSEKAMTCSLNGHVDDSVEVNTSPQSIIEDALVVNSQILPKDEIIATVEPNFQEPIDDSKEVSSSADTQIVKEESSSSKKVENDANLQKEHTEIKLYTETNLLDNEKSKSELSCETYKNFESILMETNSSISLDPTQTTNDPDESLIPVTTDTLTNANTEKTDNDMSVIPDSLQLSNISIESHDNDSTSNEYDQDSSISKSPKIKNENSLSLEHKISDTKNAVSMDNRNGSYTPDSLISEESLEKTENSSLSNQSLQNGLSSSTGSGEDMDLSNKNNNNNQDQNGKSFAEIDGQTVLESTNGCNESDECTEPETQEDQPKVNGKLSPNSKNGFDKNESSMHNGPSEDLENKEEAQLYLEFPSEKVGLLIGKMGRNIKQLKQESGAEVMVHTVPFRDDIQVLQITGTHIAVDSAASKIGRRFREVPLTEFDPSSSMGFGSQGSMLSSPGALSPLDSPVSPPTFAYPVPEMTQLRIPEGIPVEVVVSAIADCDCIFVQQYTHPTFHALASLEHAMSICYSSPSTPALLSPVQVGLVCVAEHQDVWYRAQVIHASEDSSEITIKFVDYGGYSTVPTSTVKQIRADFITLPFQAAECYLDNIEPLEGEKGYSADSTTILQELLKEGEFHARISRYRPDGIPYIRLFKRHCNVTALVNELLVNEKVARWVDDETDCMAGVVSM